MDKNDAHGRFPEYVAVKLPSDVATEVRRAAQEDSRTVSGFVRKLITTALKDRQSDGEPNRG